MKRFLFFFTIILAFTALHMLGQDPAYPPRPDQPRPDQAGPGPENDLAGPGPENDPSRGVARISLLNGEVSVRRGDSGDVVAAALNAPLVSQDRLLTSSSSRTEVQFDSGNMLRIGSNSEVRLNDVQQRRFQVQIAVGTVTFRVIRNSQSEVEIDTPSISFRPLRPGSYRVRVQEDGSTEISVRDGEAEIFGPRGTERLRAGVTVLARGSADDPEFREVAPIGLDEWDRWNQSRDRQLESSRSYEYVSPDVAGAEDLEGYGRWANDPQYGNVWVPRVEPGWAPYRSGRWVWEDYYGWTWVSYDPWGWAPYHYGRWYSGSLGWAWYPGPRYSRQYWSPALVAFFGFGGGFHSGVGFGFGNVGWVPLGPNEQCHPWWGRGVYRGFGGDRFGGDRGFGNHTTIVNNTNITNIYRNARVNNGITAVGANDFGRHTGQFVGMSGAAVREAGLVRGVLPVTPDRSSLRLADRQVRAGAFPQDRNINFAGRRSSPQTRVPFDQQQRSMDQAARQTFGAGRRNSGSGLYSGGNGTATPSSGTGQGPAANQGWRRSGDPAAQQPGAQPQNPQGGFSQRGGNGGNTGAATHEWSRFGEPIHGSVIDSGGRTNPAQTYSGTNSSYGRSSVDRGLDRGNYPQSQSDSGSNGAAGWHRFGQPSSGVSSSQAAPQASGQRTYYDNGSTRRFGGSSAYQSIPQAPIPPAPQTTYQRYSQPAQQYNAPPRDYGRGSSSQPVRISPPMVRERSAPSMDYSRGGSSGYHSVSGGGGSRSAPQSSNGGGRQNSGGGHHNSGSSNNNNNGRSGGRR